MKLEKNKTLGFQPMFSAGIVLPGLKNSTRKVSPSEKCM